MQMRFGNDNIPISDGIAADVVREIEPNDHGRSYVIYTAEFNKHGQANGAITSIQYCNGYVDQNQIIATCVSTEQEFYDAWSAMEPGDGDNKIDEVRIIMHGVYYALMIDSGAGENITVSPDGMVNSDPECIIISDLPRKSIYRIGLYSCNTGMLDAINVDFDRVDEEYLSTVHITGNVAQAFLYSQDVNMVSAWDGSVKPLAHGGARLSHEQDRYYDLINELEPHRTIEPVRNNFSNGWFWRRFIAHDKDNIHNDPVGSVLYMRIPLETYMCSYYYSEKQSDGSIVIHYVTIDLSSEDIKDTIR